MKIKTKLRWKVLLGTLVVAFAFAPSAVMAKNGGDNSKDRLDNLESDVAGLIVDTDGLRTDVDVLQTDSSTLQGNVAGLQSDVGGLQGDVAGLQSDIGGLQSDVGALSTDLSALQSGEAEQEIVVAALAAALETLNTNVETLTTDSAALGTLTTEHAALIAALQGNVADVTALSAAQAAQISALTSVNTVQQQQIGVLARKFRLSGQQEQFKRQRLAMNERINSVKKLQWLNDQGQLPATLPGLMLFNEINYNLDIAEKIRCGVAGLDRSGYDCVASDGEVIVEDEYVVPENAQVVFEEVPILIEYGVEEPVLTLEQEVEASNSAECLLYKDDPDNDFKLALCTATLGVETSQALVAIIAMDIETYIAGSNAEQGVLCEDLDLTEAELESCLNGWESMTGAWPPGGLTVEGEEPIDVPENCVASNFDPLTGTSPGCPRGG